MLDLTRGVEDMMMAYALVVAGGPIAIFLFAIALSHAIETYDRIVGESRYLRDLAKWRAEWSAANEGKK